jgi:hypothetical protein
MSMLMTAALVTVTEVVLTLFLCRNLFYACIMCVSSVLDEVIPT